MALGGGLPSRAQKNLIWTLGVAKPPPRSPWCGRATPKGRLGVAEATPMTLGGGSATPRAKKKFENFRIWPLWAAGP
jgi:hypothetical protein